MAKLLFRLNGVSDEEANDVREILKTHDLSFYETSAGRWGISVAAIWLEDSSQMDRAQNLLQEYQAHRMDQLRKSPPSYPSMWQRIRQAPLYFILLLTAILAVLYLSTIPFLSL